METKKEGRKEELAHRQGDAFTAAVEHLKENDPHVETEVGEYIITLAFEKAAGWYVLQDGELKWKGPEKNDNLHVEIIVQDMNDLRFIPYLTITCTLLDENKKEIGTKEQGYIWHPYAWHYAENWRIAGAGKYYAKIKIAEPAFRRHDQIRGKRYSQEVVTELGPFTIPATSLGSKPTGPE